MRNWVFYRWVVLSIWLVPTCSSSPRNHGNTVEERDSLVFDQEVYTVQVPEDIQILEIMLKVQATDAEGRQILYRLSDRNNDMGVFAIDQTTGDIVLLQGLDYEEQRSYELTVMAQVAGTDPMEASARVVIQVSDVNDNIPRMTINTFMHTGRAFVAENSPAGLFIAYLSVHDDDEGVNSESSCTSSSTQFAVEKWYHNMYKIVSQAMFDREVTADYSITIVCSDHGQPPLTNSQTIQVDILDRNDNPPVFSQNNYFVRIYENTASSIDVLRVTASDRDVGSNGAITYSLDPQDYLVIDPMSGLVATSAILDYERITEVTVRVFATDHGAHPLTASATINVHVVDVNDEVPQFSEDSYLFAIFENQPIGTELGRVLAFDADSDSDIRYTLAYPDDFFSVDPMTGRITSRTVLDREGIELMTLSVIAQDVAAPFFSSTSTVSILLLERNDNH